jgi:hypothetical protein
MRHATAFIIPSSSLVVDERSTDAVLRGPHDAGTQRRGGPQPRRHRTPGRTEGVVL